jgi:site-specific DNA-methyltransferase (adenine-specific)
LNETSFSTIISSRDPFGYDIRLPGSFKVAKHKYSLRKTSDADVEFYYNGWRKDGVGYVSLSSVNQNTDWIDKYKVLIPKAWGTGNEQTDKLNSFIVEPHSVCTETYLVVGPFDTLDEAKKAQSYINTKFFHAMVSLLKISQNAAKGVYELVPLQDFSENWSDEKLYEKYGFTSEEISCIEMNVKTNESTEEV